MRSAATGNTQHKDYALPEVAVLVRLREQLGNHAVLSHRELRTTKDETLRNGCMATSQRVRTCRRGWARNEMKTTIGSVTISPVKQSQLSQAEQAMMMKLTD